MRSRDLLLVIVAAVVIGLLAWLLLASGESSAPEEPGAQAAIFAPVGHSGSLVFGHESGGV